jgi:hypothetical protein
MDNDNFLPPFTRNHENGSDKIHETNIYLTKEEQIEFDNEFKKLLKSWDLPEEVIIGN